MGENSLRALASDLAYLEAWALASTGSPLPWPAPEALALKFVAQHLWDPARRDTDSEPRHAGRYCRGFARRGAAARGRPARARDGAPAPVQLGDFPSLERRRRSVQIAGAAVCDPARGAGNGEATDPEEPKGGDGDVLEALLATCKSDRLVDARDAALLLFAFASGGRRRSEVRGAARRAAHRGGAGSCRPRRS